MRGWSVGAVLATLVSAGAAEAVTFDFRNLGIGEISGGLTDPGSVLGVTFSSSSSAPLFQPDSAVVSTSSGLGIESIPADGFDPTNTQAVTLDGAIAAETLTLGFTSFVRVLNVEFGRVGDLNGANGDDVEVGGDGGVLGTFPLPGDGFVLDVAFPGLSGRTISFTAPGGDDEYTLREITVQAIPLPLPAALLLTGLAGLALAARRRN